MSKDTVISAENLSKKYCRTLKRSMVYGICDITRNALGIGSKSEILRKNEFWALDSISFKMTEGDVLGIIGANGSGKSTLLKLLNGIFWPDKGRIAIKGRVGALIEVGAGFHPLLTGRENIFLNGAILGMSRRELLSKFDDIVEFAGIGTFLDMPVKHYSSGMFVRLGFSIAVHSDPGILLIDEILSVGDMSFQLKCREKIREMRERNVAIVLVSHNMHSINNLCEHTIVLNKGKIIFHGNTGESIDVYKDSQSKISNKRLIKRPGGGIRITGFLVTDGKGGNKEWFGTGDPINFKVSVHLKNKTEDLIINISIYDESGNVITAIRNDVDGIQTGIMSGDREINLSIDNLNLLPGFYKLNVNLIDRDGFTIRDRIEDVGEIKIAGGKKVNGVAFLPHKWDFDFNGNARKNKI